MLTIPMVIGELALKPLKTSKGKIRETLRETLKKTRKSTHEGNS